ncbi:MAG: PorP/SprF family type IX secretion system membrane protein [Chitinophagaceae bacterium]|nr:PorP/SprF family type IX secretion system membrane protein [Chitinophagaceae bacterium]
MLTSNIISSEKTIFIKFVAVLIACNSFFFSNAQDIHFSQFFETPLLRNPALAGIFSGDVRVQSVFRTQWNSVTVPYVTGSVNAEYKKPVGNKNDFLTIGGQVLYDKAGTVALTATHILPVLNFHKSLHSEKNMYLSLGFMGGWVQRSIDRSKITTNSQYDGTGFNPGLADGETFLKNSYSYFDASVGMSFNAQLGENADNNLYAGIGYHHFNKTTKNSFYGTANYEMIPKWVGSAGLRLNITDYSFFTLQADYSKQGPYTETLAGVLFTYKLDDIEDPKYLIHGGAFIRWNDAIIPVAKLEMRPLSVSVSYDANISQLKAASKGRGGFEAALTFQKYLNKENSSLNSVQCPKF